MSPKTTKLVKTRLASWHTLFTVEQRADGEAWYNSAYAFADLLADSYGVTIQQAAGVIACLSPRCPWEINKRDAEGMIRAYALDLPDPICVTYGSQVDKAKRILTLRLATEEQIAGEVAGRYGPKTLAFYWNILRPDQGLHVCIDTWIMRACLGASVKETGGGNGYVKLYRELADLMRDYARSIDMVPCEFQAILWHCVKDNSNAKEYKNVKTAIERETPF